MNACVFLIFLLLGYDVISLRWYHNQGLKFWPSQTLRIRLDTIFTILLFSNLPFEVSLHLIVESASDESLM